MLGGRLTNPAQAAHLSIVVLPFANLSNDPAQDYFADGITENLTPNCRASATASSIARNTAFTYKGKVSTPRRSAGSSEFAMCSKARCGAIRIAFASTPSSIDAETGAHLRADRFEEDVADLLKLQDQVVTRLAGSLGVAVTNAYAEKGARSKNPDAIDLTVRGWGLVYGTVLFPKQDSFDRLKLTIDPDVC